MKKTDTEKKPYSSRILDGYVKLINSRYPFVDLEVLYEYAGIESYQVADPGHWFTQNQMDRFYDKLAQMSGNQNIAREAGRFFASSPNKGNLIHDIFVTIIDPFRAFRKMEKISVNFTKYTDYRIRKLSSNSVEILFKSGPDLSEKPYQCENRKGMMEAIPTFLGLKRITLEHPECLFSGGGACRYVVKWEDSVLKVMNKVKWGSLLALIGANGVNLSLGIKIPLFPSLSLSAVLFLGLAYLAKMKEVKELRAKTDSLEKTTEDFFHQIDINYNTTVIAQKVSEVINSKMTLEETVEGTIETIRELLEFDRGLILLANKEKTKLQFTSGYGFSEGYREMLDTTDFSLTNPHSRGVFVISFKEQKPFLINDVEDIKKNLSLQSIAFTRSIGAKSFICCPIVCDNETLGILSVDNIHSQRPLLQSDISLLMGIASIVGVGLKKIQLIKARETQLQSIIKVLASSIDARDPLTAGHSEKVAEYADEICRRMGLSNRYRDMIHIASMLHDYGKIGVPDSILKKNGQLTADEYDIIKTHVVKTRIILNQINFEGDLAEIPDIASSHHEQIDGGGYPVGLKGDQIPLGAKIIAVADFFDAITSRRHYRNPMSVEVAIAALKAESGWHLDPNIVDVFCEYLHENLNALRDAYTPLMPLQEIKRH
ncbi:MAG: HD domain-containing protein [Spirochaetales bacterium]|nr:HD domain-containing protein [Spirochaetales bacterium]